MFKSLSPYFEYLSKFPVDWKPFTSGLFQQALSEDKMIFLHIGQMGNTLNRKRISSLFSDKSVTEILNDSFIPVIADEEDFTEASLLGWNVLRINHEESDAPINLFLMPDGTPITSTSSCDPNEIEYLLENLLSAFTEKRSALSGMAQEAKLLVSNQIFKVNNGDKRTLSDILEQFTDDWSIKLLSFDNYFKNPPFILRVPAMLYLLEEAQNTKNPVIKGFVEQVLDKILFSAMRDPVDGGFFFEMDSSKLRKPTWEKRLNDNALLTLLLAKAYKMYHKETYRIAAEETISFIKSRMEGDFGGYIYSTNIETGEDGESYYQFTMNELREALGAKGEEIAVKIGLNPAINGDQPQIPEYTSETGMISISERESLRAIREKHSGIIKDKREITSYNMLFVSILCICSDLLNHPALAKDAIVLHQNIMLSSVTKGKGISRYPISGNGCPIEGNLADYAEIISADITLYQTTGEDYYEYQASSYLTYTLNNFYNDASGMFFKSSKYSSVLPLKMESNIDSDKPSTNSVMCDNLLRMYEITKDETYYGHFLRQVSNIQSHLVGTGPYLANWARLIRKSLPILK